jgi:hypothetical protein
MAASCREQGAEFLDLARRRRAGFRAAESRLTEQAAALATGMEGAR